MKTKATDSPRPLSSGGAMIPRAFRGPGRAMACALRIAYDTEIGAARAARAHGNVELAFHHLERAHVLSQRHTLQHVHVHWLMLTLGSSTGAWREVSGQATRILAAAVFSRIWVPAGNTGRSNVSALRPMPVPEDLRPALEGGAS